MQTATESQLNLTAWRRAVIRVRERPRWADPQRSRSRRRRRRRRAADSRRPAGGAVRRAPRATSHGDDALVLILAAGQIQAPLRSRGRAALAEWCDGLGCYLSSYANANGVFDIVLLSNCAYFCVQSLPAICRCQKAESKIHMIP